MFFFFVLLCILVGLGIGLAAFAFLIILGLGFAGVFSASVIFAWYKKSIDAGFRLFFLLVFCFCGLVLCTVLFPVLNKILHWATFPEALVTGMAIGSVAGLAAGALVFQMLKWAIALLQNRLSRTHPPQP